MEVRIDESNAMLKYIEVGFIVVTTYRLNN